MSEKILSAAVELIGSSQLNEAQFDQLAQGFGDSTTVDTLQNRQTGQRLLLLGVYVPDAVRDSGTPEIKEQSGHAHDVLSEIPSAALEEMAEQPAFGMWIADLRAAHREKAAELPARVLGLGGFAAYAAIAGGLANFELQTAPQRDGSIIIPGVGRAALNSQEEYATIRREDGALTFSAGKTTIEVPELDNPTESWQPVRRLYADEGMTVQVDDLYNYGRNYRWPTVQGISDSDHRQWQEMFAGAWDILTSHPELAPYAEGMRGGLNSLIQFQPTLPGQGRSVTNKNAFGAMAMTLPQTPEELVVGLVHEFGHSKLYGLEAIVRLSDSRDNRLFRAPWRDDPRPADGLLQGAYAHVGIPDALRVLHSTIQDPERAYMTGITYARWHRNAKDTIDLMLENDAGNLNKRGQQLLRAAQKRLDSMDTSNVPPEAAEIAEMLSVDHQVSWRLHSLDPNPTAIENLAAIWRSGDPCPDAMQVELQTIESRSGKDFSHLGRRAREVLLRRSLVDKATFETLKTNEDELRNKVPDATHADVLLISGEHETARQSYADIIQRNPHNIDTWSGLAMAYRAGSDSTARQALLNFPEVVAALYNKLPRNSTRPEMLASWLSPLAQPLIDPSSTK